MATISKVKRVEGYSYQAKLKRRGRVIKTKTFRTKTVAREWLGESKLTRSLN